MWWPKACEKRRGKQADPEACSRYVRKLVAVPYYTKSLSSQEKCSMLCPEVSEKEFGKHADAWGSHPDAYSHCVASLVAMPHYSASFQSQEKGYMLRAKVSEM
jgi:hypothetical protein